MPKKMPYYHKLMDLRCLTAEQTNARIRALVLGDAPCMVARFGAVELKAMKRYVEVELLTWPQKIRALLAFWGASVVWLKKDFYQLENNAGFFPATRENMKPYHDLMVEAAGHLDLLGSSVNGENVFEYAVGDADISVLRDFDPFGYEDPWSAALEGQRVLVVHPFAETIERQHAKRAELFANPKMLPEFELMTLKAVQSSAGGRTQFASWFEALDHMKAQIDTFDYDVALIGCGAYGFPLAAHVKTRGKKAVHLGGTVQLMFGIKGTRFEEYGLYNEHWVRPSEAERPPNADGVEQAAYW